MSPNSSNSPTPQEQRRFTQRRSLIAVAILALANIPLGLRIWQVSRKESMSFKVKGPFPQEEYGPSNGVYAGERVVSGKKQFTVDVSHGKIAEVNFFQTTCRENKLTVDIAYTFSGPPSQRQIKVAIALIDKDEHVIVKQERIETDSRASTRPKIDYLGVGFRTPTKNHGSYSFAPIDASRIQAITVHFSNWT